MVRGLPSQTVVWRWPRGAWLEREESGGSGESPAKVQIRHHQRQDVVRSCFTFTALEGFLYFESVE